MPNIQSRVLQRQAPLRAAYQKDPQPALIVKHVRTAALPGTDALHGVVIPGDQYNVSVKYGIDRAVGGDHDAPNPGELLCAALAACEDATIRMVADVLGVVLEDLEVEVIGRVDVRASLGMDVDSPLEFQTMECKAHIRVAPGTIRVAPGTPPALVQRLKVGAERSCINLATLRRGVPVDLSFDVGEMGSDSGAASA
ncbi:MAG: OsmC family protein [Gammaproteobacteria bacterium]